MAIKILRLKNNQWIDKATGKQFIGEAKVKDQTYRYTRDGKKILLTKPKPNPQRVIQNLWKFENPKRKGFVNGKYYPYTTANNNLDFGAGIDMSQQTPQFRHQAQQGFTQSEMDAEMTRQVNIHLQKVDEALKPYTNFPDTISPQIKEGLADLRHQVGYLGSNYPRLLEAVAHGNIDKIREESKVQFLNRKTGKKQYDVNRYSQRQKEYFHYYNGGKLIPKNR